MKYSIKALAKKVDEMDTMMRIKYSQITSSSGSINDSMFVDKLPCSSSDDLNALDSCIMDDQIFSDLVWYPLRV